MSGCKIGKVKLKNGAELVRLPIAHKDALQTDIVSTAAYYSKCYAPGEIQGFIMIAWSAQTSLSKVYISDASKVGISQAPLFAAEEVRRAAHQQGNW